MAHFLYPPTLLALLGLYDDNDKGVEAERQGQDLSVYTRVFEAPFLEVRCLLEMKFTARAPGNVLWPDTRSSPFTSFPIVPQETGAYYLEESQRYIAENAITDYMKQVSSWFPPCCRKYGGSGPLGLIFHFSQPPFHLLHRSNAAWTRRRFVFPNICMSLHAIGSSAPCAISSSGITLIALTARSRPSSSQSAMKVRSAQGGGRVPGRATPAHVAPRGPRKIISLSTSPSPLVCHTFDADLHRMFKLLSRVENGINSLKKSLEEHVVAQGTQAVNKIGEISLVRPLATS